LIIWILLALLMVALAIVTLLIDHQEPSQPETARRFSEVLETPQDASWLNQRKWRQAQKLTNRFRRVMERLPGSDMQEVDILMRQAAVVDSAARAWVYASLWVTPVFGAFIGVLVTLSSHAPTQMGLVFGAGIGYIIPRRFLRWMAARRQDLVREELPVVLNLMRLLFDAGLSVEHTLKAISEQARKITPELSKEFAWALTRIQSGQDRGEALEEMAKRIDVPELTETMAILKQAARYGGSLRDSLMRYLKLMEDRRMTDLRDKVGKISGQMSVITMIFMFPALLIFLAGPAVLSIVQGLSQ
jgi:tight adherence protein C